MLLLFALVDRLQAALKRHAITTRATKVKLLRGGTDESVAKLRSDCSAMISLCSRSLWPFLTTLRRSFCQPQMRRSFSTRWDG